MTDRWSTQDAKQRFSELLRLAQTDGPQIVTKHGEEVAVVIDIVDYRQLAGLEIHVDLKEALAGQELISDEAAADFEDVVAGRGRDLPRDFDLGAAR